MKIAPNKEAGLRLYQHGRGLFPSVTEVLKVIEKPYIDNWRRHVGRVDADKILLEASVFGTRIHSAARMIAEGERLWLADINDVDEDIRPWAEAVQHFLDQHVSEVLGTEVELVSPTLKFGGTLDLYGRDKDGKYAIWDYKTGSQLTREHGLQLAGYGLLTRKNDLKVNRRYAVRIKKDRPGEFYVRRYDDHEGDVEAFLALLRFWWWRHRASITKKGAA